jgi:hypothetical protein
MGEQDERGGAGDAGPSARAPRWLLVLAIAAVAAAACGLAGAWAVPTAAIKSAIDRASPDGKAWTFSAERIAAIQTRAGVLALAYGAAALLLIVIRRPARRFVERTIADAGVLWRDLWRGLARFVREEPWHAAALLAITAAGIALRLLFIDQPMKCDEAATYQIFASRPLIYAISDYPAPNNHVFYTFLEWFITRVFGHDPWSIRLPALVTGVLLIPATYGTTRALFNRDAGLLAAALAAASVYLIHYSTDARGYSIVALAFCLLLCLGAHALEHENRAAWCLMAVVAGLGFYTIPTMLFPFGACVTWLGLAAVGRIVRGGSASLFRGVILIGLLTIAVTVLCYTPILLVSGLAALTSNQFVAPMAWPEFFTLMRERTEEFGVAASASVSMAVLAALTAGVAVALAAHPRVARRPAPISLAVVMWCALVLAVQHAAPYGRVWSFLLPLLYGLSATGLMFPVRLAVRGPSGRTAAALALSAVLCTPTAIDLVRTGSPTDDYEGDAFADGPAIAAYVAANVAPSERILATHPGRPVLGYYFDRYGLPRSMLSREPGGPAFTMAVMDGTLDDVNEKLRYEKVRLLDPAQVTVVQRFSTSALCRLSPPWTPEQGSNPKP